MLIISLFSPTWCATGLLAAACREAFIDLASAKNQLIAQAQIARFLVFFFGSIWIGFVLDGTHVLDGSSVPPKYGLCCLGMDQKLLFHFLAVWTSIDPNYGVNRRWFDGFLKWTGDHWQRAGRGWRGPFQQGGNWFWGATGRRIEMVISQQYSIYI